MARLALRKKSLGIRNKTWIKICSFSNIGVSIAYLIFFLLELYSWPDSRKTDSKKNWQEVTVFVHMEVFTFVGLFVGIMICSALRKESNPRCLTYSMMISIILLVFYEFNPWIVEYQRGSIMPSILKYSFLLRPFVFPWYIGSFSFATWIIWRISDFEKDYEVIYGGENSQTKILIDKMQ